MAHELKPQPHPRIISLRLYDNLQTEDMLLDEKMGLNAGEPLYLILDVLDMNVRMPKDFLQDVRRCFYVNENLVHMALVIDSLILENVANLADKLTGRGILSFHKTYESALQDLLKRIEQDSLQASPEQDGA